MSLSVIDCLNLLCLIELFAYFYKNIQLTANKLIGYSWFCMEQKVSKEIHRKVFELTLALYRVSDFFPQGEVLRRQLREKANEVFGSISEYGFSGEHEQETISILGRIQSVKGFLEMASSLRLVRLINLRVLEREYASLEDFFEQELKNIKDSRQKEQKALHTDEAHMEILPTWDEFSTANERAHERTSGSVREHTHAKAPIGQSEDGDINDRQKKILEHIRTNSQAKISDFFSFFDTVSSKTIQRDLQDLVEKNVLKKEGEKRWTIYSLKHIA